MPTAPRAYRPPGYQRIQHESQYPSRQDPKRAIYQSLEWDQLRESIVIRDGALCQECKRKGRITPVSLHAKRGTNQRMAIVDHIIPAKSIGDVLCDPSNLETLCPSCASKKTSERDGGFGNERKGHGGGQNLPK